jgi:hypothetical protein
VLRILRRPFVQLKPSSVGVRIFSHNGKIRFKDEVSRVPHSQRLV